ncbi:NAD(P)H-binding protein [uncultured Umboniibacter sp.]|uniref:NAD(P)H-binding protein n=1 Tax=uncultured Umboniibacter sp. TaxID=1798917 RepID=UPI002637AF87|nr:NAD(P)H-binding protein [uncultured Umboniibacter sp.]
MNTAWIFGATGATGQALITLIVEQQNFSEVVCINRRPLAERPAGVTEQIVSELSPESVSELAGSPDSVFICLGTTLANAGSKAAFKRIDLDLICAVGKWCLDHQVKQVHLISAVGANRSAMSFYSRIKGETEDYFQSLKLPILTIYRPSILTQATRSDERFGEKWAARIIAIFDWLPLFAGIRRVPVKTLAHAMLSADEKRLNGTISSTQIQQLGKASD